MKSISIDLETRSSVDIGKSGVYRYAEAEDFAILLFAYAVDGGAVEVIDLVGGEQIPQEILDALTDESVIKWAFNANFERVCLSRYLSDLGMTLDPFHDNHPLSTVCARFLSPRSWRCTMVWSAYMGLPLSLAGVGRVLGLEEQKMTEGKALIRYFSVSPFHEPTGEKWELFKSYNRRDVEVEMAIQQRLFKYPVPQSVWEEYVLDQEINDRGICLDMPFVENAVKIDAHTKEKLTDRLKTLTGLENPNSVAQMKEWLRDYGVETESLTKKSVTALLATVPAPLKEVLVLRQQLAKSSVKKYQAVRNAVCADSRARGMFQFYGANRTGRFAGRIVQLQNLPQNHLPDLAYARDLVRQGDSESLNILYNSVPDVLSQLIRTAFIPKEGRRFIVADFSAIEARVLSWLAKERWRMDVFADDGDIYCATAGRMFHCNVVKHGENGHLRQKGKQAELACIAEGQLVLTNEGLVPIERVRTEHLLWDGESWVSHDGVIFKGEREIITYEGLTATPDHLVWVQGKSQPIQFGDAASCGAHLVQTGDGGTAIRLGENHQPGKEMECGNESLLRSDKMYGMRCNPVAVLGQSSQREIEGLPELFATETDSILVGQTTHSSKTTLREPERQGVPSVWRARDQVRFSECDGGRSVSHKNIRSALTLDGTGSHRYERKLHQRESTFCTQSAKSSKPQNYGFVGVSSGVLALLPRCGNEKTVRRNDSFGDHQSCGDSCQREKEELAYHQRTARLYDIRNAGKHHRFTVSGKLVHNCGYGGSVGALKAFGALESGMKEEELKPLVDAWRAANPNIVDFWWAVDRAAKDCIKERSTKVTHDIRFIYQSGMMFIQLPSGRRLSYVKPRIGENQFGGESITYMGLDLSKKWARIESYGPKFVENITQAISRDILCYAMQTLRNMEIVAHVHDEIIIECDERTSLSAVCEQMARTPPWAEGLLLHADGFECAFYQKD
ncbi:prophage LambdaSa04 DNA-directed DNA polymerase [Centipeda periodontii DSM 2778]|uniref:DNA-directed DNA polymerase n=1 Tax=Centipeda periodontii DSM 2778 TaxID=888060 RepID=F5RN38_9FIRM|nr:DNA polymerase [Centipeda periodontii]EGK59361.1 prophage LambdaSa04 DNA-directed DNA polymerase [Centipeda periodontii DSM 2778]